MKIIGPKCSLTRSVLFLGESCTSSVHIKTEEAALTLSRKQMFWLNFTLAWRPKGIFFAKCDVAKAQRYPCLTSDYTVAADSDIRYVDLDSAAETVHSQVREVSVHQG